MTNSKKGQLDINQSLKCLFNLHFCPKNRGWTVMAELELLEHPRYLCQSPGSSHGRTP